MEISLDELLSKLVEIILSAANEREPEAPIRLPPERDIAERLGVQRSTLREGLATLTHLGMIARTPGRGTFVTLPKSDFLQLYFNIALAVGYITIEDLENLREMLEREIVRRAISTADARDIFELEQLARRMELSKTAAERLEADYEFHRRLATTANSAVIELLMDGLSTVLRRVLHHRRFRVRSVPESAERMDATHMPIAAALKAKDESAAVAAIDNHFRVWSELSQKVNGARTMPRRRKTAAKKASR